MWVNLDKCSHKTTKTIATNLISKESSVEIKYWKTTICKMGIRY